MVTRLSYLLRLLLATHAYPQSAGPAFPSPGKTSMSKDNHQAIGMEVAAKVYQQMQVLPDGALNQCGRCCLSRSN